MSAIVCPWRPPHGAHQGPLPPPHSNSGRSLVAGGNAGGYHLPAAAPPAAAAAASRLWSGASDGNSISTSGCALRRRTANMIASIMIYSALHASLPPLEEDDGSSRGTSSKPLSDQSFHCTLHH
eukprot:GHVU01022017.1.p3 GENE.GHVU01022017.1~~GHVU01022017.1.p3  ORF type:complete len:124 (-),score=13.76 GHVU01022017.1:436-807(-)